MTVDADHLECRRDMRAEIERLRAYIWSLDGKHVGIRVDNGATFIDDGIIVASDVCGPAAPKSS